MQARHVRHANLVLVAVVVLVLYTPMLGDPPRSSPGKIPAPQISSSELLENNPIVFLPVLMFAVAGSFWWAVERQPLSGSVAVQYGPPLDLSPAEASSLLDDSVKARAVIGTLVDLAVRGYLQIEPVDGNGKDYIFHNLRRPNWAVELAPHECDLMVHIFEYGEEPSLTTLWHGLPEYLEQIKEHIFKSLAVKKMYLVSPILGGVVFLWGGVAVLLLFWFLTMIFGIRLAEYEVLYPICFGLALAVIFFFSRKFTLKSALGKERWRQVKGFQDFVQHVEADRMKTVTPDMFEKFLPYAIALGVETQWAATFKGMLTRPLSWYTGAMTEFLSALDE
jgi:hypothetical protein